MQVDNITKNAKSKSIGAKKDRAIRVSAKKMKRFMILSLAIMGISVTANIAQVGARVADHIEKNQVVNEFLDDAYDKVREETHIASNHVDYYYDVSDLISYVEEKEDEIPERLYGVLSSIGFDASYNQDELDSIVCSVYRNEDGSKMYDSFEDFLIKNDYVDKDGKASTDVYKDKMRNYIYAKEQYQRQVEEIKGTVR